MPLSMAGLVFAIEVIARKTFFSEGLILFPEYVGRNCKYREIFVEVFAGCSASVCASGCMLHKVWFQVHPAVL